MLTQHYNWLQSLIDVRLAKPVNKDYKVISKDIPLPDLSDSIFSQLVKQYKLNAEEQIILLLSLASYMQPTMFTTENAEATKQHKQKLFLNSSFVNSSNYPSIETALFLLAGSDMEARLDYFSLFSSQSKLITEDIITIPKPPDGEPFTKATLQPGQSILNVLLNGKAKGPEYSHDFPATRIRTEYTWEDLILDCFTRERLAEIKDWLEFIDICKKDDIEISKFNKGYKCLFHGPPGTGKSMAAALIGKLTGHAVYRIDLSSVVSKYIGETEKNLGRVFDRAAHGNWILFFDEADALFGKRGVTQNAHDRYANQEVSYLLQRFETYEGVSILASNFKENIDTAFFRRFNSIVSFKKPKTGEREKLWKVHLPKDFTFAKEINLSEVADSIKINGAGIHNVLRRSCMKAVLRGNKELAGKDILESIKLEFAKENKTLL